MRWSTAATRLRTETTTLPPWKCPSGDYPKKAGVSRASTTKGGLTGLDGEDGDGLGQAGGGDLRRHDKLDCAVVTWGKAAKIRGEGRLGKVGGCSKWKELDHDTLSEKWCLW